MTLTPKYLYLAAAFTAAVSVYAIPAFAASLPNQTNQTDVCAITKADLAAIRSIQADPTLSYNAELAAELAARKALLLQTISCAETQINTVQAELAGASGTASNQAQAIQVELNGKLNDALNYYELERGKLTDAGIAATEQVAGEVLSWRASTFAPISDQVDNFLLWTGNQSLFSTAATRMAQVGQVVSFLAPTNNAGLAAAYAGAQASFQTAEDQNTAAEQALAQSQSGSQVTGLIQQSLQSLADTYKNLFTVSQIVQNFVPQAGQ
jgi:hypothetical protein